MVEKVIRSRTFLSAFLFVITALVLCFYFNDFVLHLNDWNFGSSEDRFKNIFTFKEFVKHGQGFYLNNINYPFGEHVIYTDAQPAISYLCKLFHIENYSTFVLHFLLLFSVCVCSVLIFHILLKFKLPLGYSFIVSLLISLLSPQLSRIVAHYGLSYGMYIPLLLYIFIVIDKSVIYRSCIASLVILIFSFIHPYYLAIGLLFCLCFLFVNFCFSRIDRKSFLFSTMLILSSIIIFKTIMMLTDPVHDRPDNPYGHWEYRSTFSGVFVAQFHPFKSVFKGLGFRKFCEYESQAYVGIIGIPVLLFLIYIMANNMRKKRKRSVRFLSLNPNLNILLLTAFITWLVACYYPFRLGLEGLLEYTGPYRQFRGLGRIGWLFYYGFTIVASYYIYIIYRSIKRKHKIISVIFISTIILFWTMDANGYLNIIHTQFQGHENDFFKQENLLNDPISRLDMNKYDAVLCLPFFNVGNEHLIYSGDYLSQQNAYYMAYHYNKPFISLEASRTSWSQSQQAIQLLSNELIPKEFIKNIGKNKKLLIISERKSEDSSIWLIKNASYLLSSPRLNFYAFDFDLLREPIKAPENYLNYDSLKICTLNFPLRFEDFDNDKTLNSPLFSHPVKIIDQEQLLNIPLDLSDTMQLEFSWWTQLDSSTTSRANATIEIKDKTNQIRAYSMSDHSPEYNLYKNGERREMTFPVFPADKSIRINVNGYSTIFNYLLKPGSIPLKISTTDPSRSLFNNFEFVSKP